MNSVKNIKVNENAIKKKKKYKLHKSIAIVILAASLLIGGHFAATTVIENMNQNQIQTIVNYYGKDSKENLILEYIEIADKLDALDLERIQAGSDLYEKHNISSNIISPEEINNLIKKYKEISSNISSKDVNKLSESIEVMLTLKKQEQLVNKYIYTVGYSVAYQNVSEATKKYTGEVFGVADYEDITFKHNSSTSAGFEGIVITNNIDRGYFGYDRERYTIEGFINKAEKNIKAGVESMIKTNTDYDKDLSDNDDYNRTRNKYIKEALEHSAKLEKEVEDKDLYNSKMAGKLK